MHIGVLLAIFFFAAPSSAVSFAESRIFHVEIQVPEERYPLIEIPERAETAGYAPIRVFKVNPEKEFPRPIVTLTLKDGDQEEVFSEPNSLLLEKLKSLFPEDKGYPVLDLNTQILMRFWRSHLSVDFIIRRPFPNIFSYDPFNTMDTLRDSASFTREVEEGPIEGRRVSVFQLMGSSSYRFYGTGLLRLLNTSDFL